MASVTTMGYFGFLAGPPFIGFTAELLGLRCALGIKRKRRAISVALLGLAGAAVGGDPADSDQAIPSFHEPKTAVRAMAYLASPLRYALVTALSGADACFPRA